MATRKRVPKASTIAITADDMKAADQLKVFWDLPTLKRPDIIRLCLQRALAAEEKKQEQHVA